MRELNWIVQTSLDGFVAGPKGEFDNFIGGEENLEFVCSITDKQMLQCLDGFLMNFWNPLAESWQTNLKPQKMRSNIQIGTILRLR